MVDIVYVAPENIGAVWPMFRKYCDRVLPMTRRRRCATRLLFDLMNNDEILWLAMDRAEVIGFTTSSVVQYDDVKLLQVRLLAGDRFDEWIDDMHERLERFARDNGCDGMELIGRRGWVRKLARFGWREAFVTCEKRFP